MLELDRTALSLIELEKQFFINFLSATEIKCIDDVLHKLGCMNATAISECSHKDVPWMVTNPKEIIDYETVFYRTPDYIVREYTNDDLR